MKKEQKNTQIVIRCTATEKKTIETAAQTKGVTVTKYLLSLADCTDNILYNYQFKKCIETLSGLTSDIHEKYMTDLTHALLNEVNNLWHILNL